MLVFHLHPWASSPVLWSLSPLQEKQSLRWHNIDLWNHNTFPFSKTERQMLRELHTVSCPKVIVLCSHHVAITCSELPVATAFKAPTDFWNKYQLSVLLWTHIEARNRQAYELWRDTLVKYLNLCGKHFILSPDTTLWLWWNKSVGVSGHQAAQWRICHQCWRGIVISFLMGINNLFYHLMILAECEPPESGCQHVNTSLFLQNKRPVVSVMM